MSLKYFYKIVNFQIFNKVSFHIINHNKIIFFLIKINVEFIKTNIVDLCIHNIIIKLYPLNPKKYNLFHHQ